MNKILLVEDDPKISDYILSLVRSDGMSLYLVDRFQHLQTLIHEEESFSIILLDRLLGDFDTKNIIPEIRKNWKKTPILVLSAINSPIERAEALNLGADDYLGKPFLGQELLARIKALSRRASPHALQEEHRRVGNLIVNLVRRTVSSNGREEPLPGKEFLLLRCLSADPGRVLSRNELMDSVWGHDTDLESNVLESTITNLRRRLDTLSSTIKIKNLRSVGYWIEV